MSKLGLHCEASITPLFRFTGALIKESINAVSVITPEFGYGHAGSAGLNLASPGSI